MGTPHGPVPGPVLSRWAFESGRSMAGPDAWRRDDLAAIRSRRPGVVAVEAAMTVSMAEVPATAAAEQLLVAESLSSPGGEGQVRSIRSKSVRRRRSAAEHLQLGRMSERAGGCRRRRVAGHQRKGARSPRPAIRPGRCRAWGTLRSRVAVQVVPANGAVSPWSPVHMRGRLEGVFEQLVAGRQRRERNAEPTTPLRVAGADPQPGRPRQDVERCPVLASSAGAGSERRDDGGRRSFGVGRPKARVV